MSADGVVAALWYDVLGTDSRESHLDFYELGGDSLRAIQLAGRIGDALDVDVSASTILELRTLAAVTRAVSGQPSRTADRTGPAREGQRLRTLSAAQRAILLADQMADEPGLYNVTLALMLDGPLDAAVLAVAIQRLVDRHEALRCRLVPTSNGPALLADDHVEVVLERYRVDADRDAVANACELAAGESKKPLPLDVAPPMRALLVELGERRSLLALVLHHVISDRRSRELMAHQLVELYDTLLVTHPAGTIAPPAVRAEPATGPAVRSADHLTGPIDVALRDRLRRFNGEQGATTFAVLLAAFAVLWYRCTGEAAVRVGVPMSTRRSVDDLDAVGCYIEVRPLAVHCGAGRSFVDLVGQVSGGLREMHGSTGDDAPVDMAVTYIERRPLPSRRALRWEWVELPAPGARFALDLMLLDDGSAIEVRMDHRRSFAEPGLAKTFAERYVRLLGELLRSPGCDLDDIELCSAVDLDRLASWAQGGPVRQTVPVPALVGQQALERPFAPAIVTEQDTLTYAELDQRASRLAQVLAGTGAPRETVVALCCEPSSAFVVGALAVLKAGLAYLALDTSAPPDRIARIVQRCGVRLALAQGGLAGLIPPSVDVLDLDGDDGHPTEPLAPIRPHPRSLAYVAFTSGSTGHPKGVQVEHASLAALAGWMIAESGIVPGDRCSQIAALGFDAVSWEVWSCLAAGATLHVAPAAARTSADLLARWLERSGITVAFVPTPTLTHLLAVGRSGAGRLRVLHTGGDVLHRFRPDDARYRLVNSYGPTETTVIATAGEVGVASGEAGRPTIGRPIGGATVHVLDRGLRRQIPGALGELYVGGAGVARGYLADPAQTAERFRPDPFSATPGARMYRTGDLARYRSDGQLEFLGRRDRQVKVSGVRIEPAEVETALANLPGIRQAAVTVSQVDDRRPLLTAHVVTDQGRDPADIQRDLAMVLPRTMLPTRIRVIAAMPLTANGKVDLRALDSEAPDQPIAPRTPVEVELAAIWSEVLSAQPVSVDDHLIEAGGNSLAAARMAVLIGDRFGVELSIADILDKGTIAAIALELAERSRA